MEYQTFTLASRDEVARFELLLDQYLVERAQFPLRHISLPKAFDQCQQRVDGGRIFSAILDVYLNFSLLWVDMHSAAATWSQYFSKGKLEGGSVLDSQTGFSGKMDIHRFHSSFILRYRALWDKLMGLLVLLNAADDYELFVSARSRKRQFKKIALSRGFLTPESITNLESMLTEFDDTFRTPEAHGTGALRKYSFTMESMDKNPSIQLIGYWNAVNSFLAHLGKTFPDDELARPGAE